MSRRGCAQLKRMLESQNVQESPLGAGQQVFIGPPRKNRAIGSRNSHTRGDRMRWSGLTGHAQRPVTPPLPPR
jgi:hypothetical protein